MHTPLPWLFGVDETGLYAWKGMLVDLVEKCLVSFCLIDISFYSLIDPAVLAMVSVRLAPPLFFVTLLKSCVAVWEGGHAGVIGLND